MLKASQLQGFNVAKPGASGAYWAGGTVYALTLVDPGEISTGVEFNTYTPSGSCSPATFSGKTIREINDYPAIEDPPTAASANITLEEAVVSTFITSVTINGVTLYTASATFDDNGGLGPSTWEWAGVNFVGGAAGTYAMEIA